ncbi:hypothetical protein JCM24511_00310 [Saitozyma sp. JCM 24511]|nr:hypothetical protein JCM24511_00310 [Saitozyma sp. JCM 24511]
MGDGQGLKGEKMIAEQPSQQVTTSRRRQQEGGLVRNEARGARCASGRMLIQEREGMKDVSLSSEMDGRSIDGSLEIVWAVEVSGGSRRRLSGGNRHGEPRRDVAMRCDGMSTHVFSHLPLGRLNPACSYSTAPVASSSPPAPSLHGMSKDRRDLFHSLLSRPSRSRSRNVSPSPTSSPSSSNPSSRAVSPSRQTQSLPQGQQPRSRRPHRHQPPLRVSLLVPARGLVFMPSPLLEASSGTWSQELSGDIEIDVPEGSGRVRCNAITVALKSVSRLNLGPMRGWEDDVLFERKVEIRGRIVLEEGKQRSGQAVSISMSMSMSLTNLAASTDVMPDLSIVKPCLASPDELTHDRFDFTIVVPTNLGPHDWHPNGRITHTLTAEVVGQSKSSSSWFSSLSLSSPKHGSHNGTGGGHAVAGGTGSGGGSGGAGAGAVSGPDAGAGPSATSPSPTGRAVSPHPAPPPPPDSSRTGRSRSRGRAADKNSGRSKSKSRGGGVEQEVDPPDAMGIARQMLVSWEDPSASSSKEGEDGAVPVPWLVGTYETHRPIRLVYNPDVAGGVTSLDMDIPIRAAGLGRVHLRWTSKVWTVCAPLQTSLRISADPEATIYSLRVSLTQTTTIHTPRDVSAPTHPADVEGIKTVRQYEIWKQGVRPRKGEVLGENTPALWRKSRFGEGRGGAGAEEGDGERERESGESGEEYVVRGVGRLPDDKTMRPSTLEGILTPIKVSHSLLLEIWFSVDQPKSIDGQINAAPPELSVMRTEKSVIVPSTCPPTSLLHARHDLDPGLVGDPSGVCKLCAERISGAAEEVWKGCACGMRLEDMEEWMEGAVGEGEGEGQGRADWKYEVERGRTA